MRRLSAGTTTAILLLLLGAASPAARGQVAVAVDEEPFEAMQGRIVAFVGALVDYTKDVRLDPEGLESVLEHHASLVSLHDGAGDGELIERALVDGRYDFDVLVSDPAFVAWCRERGLDGPRFFQQLLRLQALRMRQESVDSLERASAELPESRGALEEMRERMGEERYREGLRSLETAAAMIEETRVLMQRLPVPTAGEGALLEAHADRIRATLEAGGVPE